MELENLRKTNFVERSDVTVIRYTGNLITNKYKFLKTMC